jgi:hypothetical protein
MIWNTVVFRWEKERRTEDESTRQLLFSNVPKETIKRKIRTRKQKPEEEEKKKWFGVIQRYCLQNSHFVPKKYVAPGRQASAPMV